MSRAAYVRAGACRAAEWRRGLPAPPAPRPVTGGRWRCGRDGSTRPINAPASGSLLVRTGGEYAHDMSTELEGAGVPYVL